MKNAALLSFWRVGIGKLAQRNAKKAILPLKSYKIPLTTLGLVCYNKH